MASAMKWIIGFVIVAVIGLVVWYSGWLTPNTAPQTAAPQTQAAASAQATNTPPQNTNGMSAQGDTSDAAIAQDAGAVDAQLQGLTTDTTAIDASLNDKPVAQAY